MRRSTRERGEHENERVDDRRPPSITCGEGSAKITGAEDVIMEREGSGGGARTGMQLGAAPGPEPVSRDHGDDLLPRLRVVERKAAVCQSCGTYSPSFEGTVELGGNGSRETDASPDAAQSVGSTLNDRVHLRRFRGIAQALHFSSSARPRALHVMRCRPRVGCSC